MATCSVVSESARVADEDLSLIMVTLMRLEGKLDMILALLGADGGEEEADL